MLERFADPCDFVAAVRGDVEPDVEHAMALGFVHGLREPDPAGTFLATWRGSTGALELLVVRPMPGRAVVEQVGDRPVESAALEAAARALHGAGAAPENLLVTEPLAQRFMERWLAVTGASVTREVRMRLHRLVRVRAPRAVSGAMRLAGASDLELALDWSNGYLIDIGFKAASDPPPTAMPPLENGALHLWEVDGAPRSMAAWSRPTPSSCAINWVYTPPGLRGRGYASALVAALSQLVLDGLPGHAPRRSVNLMTDVDNAQSNRIYAALGYEPLRDFTSFDVR